MKILDRYVGKNIIITSIFGVVVLSLVLILGKIFKEVLDLLINHDVPLKYVVAFFIYALPFSLTFTIPWGFLTALLLIFGRMSADNELIALKANGISIPRVCIPVFILSIFLSIFC
ncbi:MAG: LptF/LptG family permease, partial [Chthoniobacterales bacterium]